jgi:hypothetical protein
LRREDKDARISIAEFKMLVREQFFMLLLDQEAALAAIPKMLPQDMDARRAVFATIREVLSAAGDISGETRKRLDHVASLFGLDKGAPEEEGSPFRPEAKAS